ncbi:MAG TPA: putative glycoside hydrolase [Candidatus Saccharimonadales bacterium]|jgi:hypothetical protein
MAFPTPLSAFSFNEGTGPTAKSEVGGYSLTPVNWEAAWGTGTAGAAAVQRFTGPIGTVLSTWSLQFDVYISSLSGWSSILQVGSFYMEFNGSGVFDAYLGGSDPEAVGATLATGTWYNIAVTHDNALNQTKIYTNGSLTATKTHAAATAVPRFDLTVQVCGSTSQPMSGRVDNLRLWNSVLTLTELNAAAAVAVSLPGAAIRIWNGSSWFAANARIWNGSAWIGSAGYPLTSPGSSSLTEFPRLGGMLIGDPHNYHQTAYQQQIAQLDLAILGCYNMWSQGGKSPAQVVTEIKSYNPDILLGNYTVMTEVMTDTNDTATQDLRAKLSSEVGPGGVGDWWGYNAAGQRTNWSGGTYPVHDTNLTLQTTPDANGDRWPQWLAKRDNSLLISTAGWDIWYTDNNFAKPRIDDDWDRDGVNDNANSTAVQDLWRDGQRAYYDTALALQPSKIIMINADNDLDGSVFAGGATGPFTQYKNLVGAAFLEHVIGESWSVETWGGWNLMMGWYRTATANLVAPKACVFDAYLGGAPTDYQTLRYAFASSLLDDGYFSVSSNYNEVLWYDEFDLAGSSTTKWLGTATDGPQLTAWQNGVYRRRFAGGMILVNPKGNGAQTVTIGAGYHRFQGRQDAVTNNGQAVISTVTLADRDGLFLVKD